MSDNLYALNRQRTLNIQHILKASERKPFQVNTDILKVGKEVIMGEENIRILQQ